jgi:hypothetical protein
MLLEQRLFHPSQQGTPDVTTCRTAAWLLTFSCAFLPTAGFGQGAPTTPSPIAAAVPAGGGRLLLEGGWAVPLGDLADGLDATPRGSGSRPGFELGLRWRFPLTPAWSVAPSFHFLGYGDATGLGADGEASLAATSLRYGAELLLKSTRDGSRLFLGLTPCVVRSHLKGPGKDHLTLIDASSTGLGLTARAGVQLGNFEVSAVYHGNRFRSFAFFPILSEQTFNWDTVVLRIGWHLP